MFIFYKKFKKFLNLPNKRGFSLIELLIVSAIFTLITSVVMIKFSLFNNQILTTNLAYDIALSIRQAQSFGINVRGYDSGGATTFTSGYGVFFTPNNNTRYRLFADADNNKNYRSSESLEVYNILGGHTIKDVCAVSGASTYCFSTGNLPNLSIVFTRPDPDASIQSSSPTRAYDEVTITVTSSQGIERSISVFSTGQISINQN